MDSFTAFLPASKNTATLATVQGTIFTIYQEPNMTQKRATKTKFSEFRQGYPRTCRVCRERRSTKGGRYAGGFMCAECVNRRLKNG